MANELIDKGIVVTGGGSGIGRETALAMAREGATVVIADLGEASGEAVAETLRAGGGQAMAQRCDVTSAADIDRLFDAVIARYGRVDGAFNNAGIEGKYARTAEYTEFDWQQTIAVNLTGVFLCMRREIQDMLQNPRGGTIVNAASVTGLAGWRGAPAYSASKHGVIGLTRTAALEYARRRIRINAVCPGVIETPMGVRILAETPGAREKLEARHPMGRLGQPSEVAQAVVWLCSDRSSFTTGHALTMDGGFVAA